MKRILAAMLIISMTAGITLQNVKASDEEIYYSESQIESMLKIIQKMNRYLKNVYVRMRELPIGR